MFSRQAISVLRTSIRAGIITIAQQFNPSIASNGDANRPRKLQIPNARGAVTF